MDELVQWLSAQLADDEAHAKKDLWAAGRATPGRWRARYGTNLDHSWVETESTPVLRLDAAEHEADALLVARFKPETVRQRAEEKLRDIDAKRATIRDYEKALRKRDECEPNTPAYRHWDNRSYGLLLALRHAGAVYADRPGYREDWRP